MSELSGENIKLEIDDFGQNGELNRAIRDYHGLCVDLYSVKLRMNGYIHSKSGIRRVF